MDENELGIPNNDLATYRKIASMTAGKRSQEDTDEMIRIDSDMREKAKEYAQGLYKRIKEFRKRNPILEANAARTRIHGLGIQTHVSMDLDATKEALLTIQSHRDMLAPMLADYISYYSYLKGMLEALEGWIMGCGLDGSEWELRSWVKNILPESYEELAEVESTLQFVKAIEKHLSYQTMTISRVLSVDEVQARIGTSSEGLANPTMKYGRQSLDDLDVNQL